MPDRSLRTLLFAGCLVLSLCVVPITPALANDAPPAVAPTGDVAPALPTAADETGARCTAGGPDDFMAASVPLFTIQPRPTYCDECRPCTTQADCGYDSGYLGVCSPSSSYCGYPSYSACVCY